MKNVDTFLSSNRSCSVGFENGEKEEVLTVGVHTLRHGLTQQVDQRDRMPVLEEGSTKALLVWPIEEVQAVGDVAEAKCVGVRLAALTAASRGAAGAARTASCAKTRVLHQLAVDRPELLKAVVVEARPQLFMITALHVVDDAASMLEGVGFFYSVHVHGFDSVSIQAMQQILFRKILKKNENRKLINKRIKRIKNDQFFNMYFNVLQCTCHT